MLTPGMVNRQKWIFRIRIRKHRRYRLQDCRKSQHWAPVWGDKVFGREVVGLATSWECSRASGQLVRTSVARSPPQPVLQKKLVDKLEFRVGVHILKSDRLVELFKEKNQRYN